MEGNDTSIYQWLSTVEQQQEQSGGQDVGKTHRGTLGADTATRLPHIQLELGSRTSTTRKRGAGWLEETETSIPECDTRKRSRYSYEPRPRHKTRQDRYEYKGPSSSVDAQLQTRGKQTKRSRCRRHTMNDDFHASNVTRNRLTLRNNMNMGIFSKGKISSPTNHCGTTSLDTVANAASKMKARRHSVQSDHTFSEMSFLSRGNHPSLHHRDGSASEHERECHQELQSDHRLRDSKLGLSHSSNNSLRVKRKLDISHEPSFTVEEPNASKVSADAHKSQNATPEPPTRRRKTLSRSPSIPYTWSESDADGVDESGLEQYLLNIMHVGLDHHTLCPEDSKPVLARRLWSLSELWVLLWERKAFWPNETVNEKQGSPGPKVEQQAAAEVASEKPQENISPDNQDSVKVSQRCAEMPKSTPKPMDETACTASSDGLEQHSFLGPEDNVEQEKDETVQSSVRKEYLNVASNVAAASNNHHRSTETWNEDNCEFAPLGGPGDDSAFPTPTLGTQQVHVPDIDIYEISQVDDDNEFYHTLDAAYNAIMSPGLAAEIAPDLQQLFAFHELDGPLGVPSCPQPTRTAGHVDQTRDTEEEESKDLATVSENTIQPENHDSRPPEPCQRHQQSFEHSNYPIFHQNNDLSDQLPWLATEYVEPTLRALPENNTRTSQHPDICEFWRQNRLY
ncbi:hypothetical protein N7535_007576 [Penicillium sp. DV-2018c]|nr:hypothetical protein N7535_007576 [Penicillium sp. DV-2018c]